MVSFGERKKILFFAILLGLSLALGIGAYFIFQKALKCGTGLFDRGKVLECGLARQSDNRVVVVGKINKLIKNKDQEIFAEITLENIKGKTKNFLFLLNSGGVLPVTLHQGQDISTWNGNENQYLRFTAYEFSKIQERLMVGRVVYLPLLTDCGGKYCNNNRLLLDWLNGIEVKFDILKGKCYLNSNQVEYSLAD